MISYLITLNRKNDGHTYKWLREYLKPWKNTVSIVDECSTDKRKMPLILVEFFDGIKEPDEHFTQELDNDEGVFDYTRYSDEYEGDEDEDEEEDDEENDEEEEYD